MHLTSFKKYENYIFPIGIWLVIFIFILPAFNLGFDLTDEGWQLAKSWGISHGDFENNADLIWGSSFLNGLWMLLKNEPSLLWSRIGFLLFIPFLGTVLYLIIKEFYPGKYAFFSVITAFLLFNKTFIIYYSMNYYYLPVFASFLSFLFLIKFHKSEKYTLTYLILSGAFAGFSVHLKFTYILIIPLFIIYYHFFNKKKSLFLKSSIYYYGSLFFAILAGFIILLIFGGAGDLVYEHSRLSIFNMFGYFFGNSTVNSSLNYSAKNLMDIYFKDTVSVLNFALIPFLLFLSCSYFYMKYSRLKYLILLLFGTITYLYIYQNISDSHLKMISAVLGIETYFLFYLKKDNPDYSLLFFIFLSVFALSFLGSGTGFYGGVFSLGFMCFSAFTFSAAASLESPKLNSKIVLPLFIIIALISQFSKSYSPYRDLPSEYLNEEFRSAELKGIYSFKERVQVVDEFMDFAKTNSLKNDRVIFVGMPMFYYLLDIKPVISETYDVILGFEQLKKEVLDANPNIIVVPVQSPRGQLWPLPQNAGHWTKDGFERQTAHYYKFYKEYLNRNNFKNIFENKMFIAYRKPDLLREEKQP